MQLVLHEVDAALVSLQVIQAEEQIDFVVFKHRERTLNCVAWSTWVLVLDVHVTKMDSPKDLGTSNTDCHASKSLI